MKPRDCELVGIDLKKSVLIFLVPALLAAATACRNPEGEKSVQSVMLSCGDQVITRSAFEDHLELKMAAYPMNIRKIPDEFNSMVMSLVNELTEELVLVRAARENGIVISESEYRKAEKDIKADYPGDSFEKMLLRNAVDYPFWKKRFKRELLMSKFIEQELLEKIEITSSEVISYYNQLQADAGKQVKKEKEQARMNEEELVAWIRRQKAQKQYEEWVRELVEKFPVEVDNEKLKSILKSVPKEKG